MFRRKDLFLLLLLGKRRHHDKDNAVILKFVNVFEPKLQFMSSFTLFKINYRPNLILKGFNQLTVILHDMETWLELTKVKINKAEKRKKNFSHFLFQNGFKE